MGCRLPPLDLTLDDPERSKVKVTFFQANYLRNSLLNCTKFSRILLGCKGNYWVEPSPVTESERGVLCSVDINSPVLTGQREPGPLSTELAALLFTYLLLP